MYLSCLQLMNTNRKAECEQNKDVVKIQLSKVGPVIALMEQIKMIVKEKRIFNYETREIKSIMFLQLYCIDS